MLRVRGQWLRRAGATVLAGALGAFPLGTAADSLPPGTVLQIKNEARPQGPNLVFTGLYGAVGAGNVLLTNDHDQGYNANAQIPISSPAGTSPLMAITGAYQTILPNGKPKDINLPKNSPFVAGTPTVTSPLVDFTGAVAAAQAASQNVIAINGSVSLRADGTLRLQTATGSQVFGPSNWQAATNPLKTVLSWDGQKFNLDLTGGTLIKISGLLTGGDNEGAGLDLRADLTYRGVGAIVVQTVSTDDDRGIKIEGEEKHKDGAGNDVHDNKAVHVLATQPGDGLAFITNGRIKIEQEGASAVPTVQAFLYAQGFREGGGEMKGIKIEGGTLQGMAVGGFIKIESEDTHSGTMTDQIVINGQTAYLSIPPQFPGGAPTYTATISNWREATK